jgi:hypothetical protein
LLAGLTSAVDPRLALDVSQDLQRYLKTAPYNNMITSHRKWGKLLDLTRIIAHDEGVFYKCWGRIWSGFCLLVSAKHTVFSVFLHAPDDVFSGARRLAVVFSALLSDMLMNALFFGNSSGIRSTFLTIIIINILVIIIIITIVIISLSLSHLLVN